MGTSLITGMELWKGGVPSLPPGRTPRLRSQI